MAGDIVVMSGHALWNLVNSVSIAIINLVLNAVLIPLYGLTGAAIGTAIAALIIYPVQLWEVHHLLAIHLNPSLAFRPLFFAVLPAGFFITALFLLPDHSKMISTLLVIITVFLYVLFALRDKKTHLEEENKEPL